MEQEIIKKQVIEITYIEYRGGMKEMSSTVNGAKMEVPRAVALWITRDTLRDFNLIYPPTQL
jgi:hypothetical protein